VDLEAILARHQNREGPLLPILHAVQEEAGYISEETIHALALALNLSRAEVSGVVSFYHDFKRSPDSRPAIKLCRAESCQARGGEAIAAHAERVAGDRVRVETVYCLGLCSVGPSAMIGEEVHGRLDNAAVEALVKSL